MDPCDSGDDVTRSLKCPTKARTPLILLKIQNPTTPDQANSTPVSNGTAVANYDRMFKLQKTYFFLNERNHVFDADKLSLSD
jgi:hypothetical protein